MKILHLCLANFYIDKHSYQENILPRMHKRMGHEVKIIASTETFIGETELGYVEPSEYINEDGIPVKRISYIKWLPSKIVHKMRIYSDVYQSINAFSPDFIFIHDLQFLSIIVVRKYLIKNSNVKAVVDGHTDFFNSAKNFLSYQVLHKIIYKLCAKIIEPCVCRFYGTLPARVDFFISTYGIPKEKLSLLPMGIDDDVLSRIVECKIGETIRRANGIKDEDFLIVTGGKLNHDRPETLSLMEAVIKINKPNLKLAFFGIVADEYSKRFDELCASSQIINLGWQETNKTCAVMAAGDLVVFPGLHSVMWEQAVALGKPCVFRRIRGFEHVDIGGNAIFLEDTSTDAMMRTLESIIDKNNPAYQYILKAANSKKKEMFLYSRIAEQSLSV